MIGGGGKEGESISLPGLVGFTEDGSVRAGGDRETSLEPQVEF